MNAALTILTSVIIFIAGQIIMKFLVDPILEYKKNVAAIDKLLFFEASRLSFGEPLDSEGINELRNASAAMRSAYSAIPMINLNRRIFSLPDESDISFAAMHLSYIYNCRANTENESESMRSVGARYKEAVNKARSHLRLTR
ncbi:hypothetical protein [Klebsiella variicola]|uniref:hypothetical protein n=1 Tax=Klebsiella variicola TaxID=244366 RepID=UPI000E3D1672|nr:hypothetical protein [Klebsiella variicola]